MRHRHQHPRQRVVIIWALASTMRGWRVLYTLPLWAGILFGTIVECRATYFTPFDYMFRQTGQRREDSMLRLDHVKGRHWPNDEGHVEHVLFHDLKVADDRLKSLKALPSLKDLEMNGRGVTDAASCQLDRCRQVGVVEVVRAQVSDAGLIHLKAFEPTPRVGPQRHAGHRQWARTPEGAA